MRIWQDYLLNYPTACSDFLEWGESAQRGIINQIKEAAMNNNVDKLKSLGIELKVYENILNIFRAEQREQQAQNERSTK